MTADKLKKHSKKSFMSLNTVISILIYKIMLDFSIIFVFKFYTLNYPSFEGAFSATINAFYYGYGNDLFDLLSNYVAALYSIGFWNGSSYLNFLHVISPDQNFDKVYALLPLAIHFSMLWLIKICVTRFIANKKIVPGSDVDDENQLDNAITRSCIKIAMCYALPIAIYGLIFGLLLNVYVRTFGASENNTIDYAFIMPLIFYALAIFVIGRNLINFSTLNTNSSASKSELFKAMFNVASSGIARAAENSFKVANNKLNNNPIIKVGRGGEEYRESILYYEHTMNYTYARKGDSGGSDFFISVVLFIHYLMALMIYGVLKMFGAHKRLSIGK